MKYCYACGHRTGGEPLFCNYCGRSYDVKLCPKLHANPRTAEACSQCGIRDLSIPQPTIPILWLFLALLVQTVFALLLLSLSLPLVIAFLSDLARRSQITDRLFVGVFVVIILWAFWFMLPDASRWIIHRLLIKKSDSRDGRSPR
jgi:hypothetical protein